MAAPRKELRKAGAKTGSSIAQLPPGASICTTAELAAALGRHKVTVSRWGTERREWRACKLHRNHWSVQRLRNAGILADEAVSPS